MAYFVVPPKTAVKNVALYRGLTLYTLYVLGAFAKWRKAPTSFIKPAGLSVLPNGTTRLLLGVF